MKGSTRIEAGRWVEPAGNQVEQPTVLVTDQRAIRRQPPMPSAAVPATEPGAPRRLAKARQDLLAGYKALAEKVQTWKRSRCRDTKRFQRSAGCKRRAEAHKKNRRKMAAASRRINRRT